MMLHAAAMLIGIFLLALLVLSGRDLTEAAALAAMIAAVCVLFAARFGGIGRTAFGAPQVLFLSVSCAGAVLRGALSTMRAAIAADVTLQPALVRVRTRTQAEFTRAVLAHLMSAPPGIVIVEADADGMLAHVTDEDGVDAVAIGALEARVIAALEPGRAS
jgi:multisubunit Na+/H+ antiporter MnhE subunit